MSDHNLVGSYNRSVHFTLCEFVYLDEYYNLHFPEGTKLGYDAPSEIRAMSDPHWFTFPPVHPFIQHIIAIVYFLLFSVCVTGNLMVIGIFLRPAARRKPSSFLVASLAGSDIIMILTQAPPLFLGALFSKYWAFGRTWCQIYAFAGGTAGCTSIWLVVFIGYDLYMHLSKRCQKKRGVTARQAGSMVLFSVIYSAATNAPPFFGWGEFKPEGMLITCSFDYLTRTPTNRAFVVYLTFFDFILPMIPLIILYWKICWEVIGYYTKQNKVMATLGMPKHIITRLTKYPMGEVRISRLCFTVVFVWILAWTPYTIVCLVGQFGDQKLITPLASQFPALFAKCASCFNPLIYTACHPNFNRKRVKKQYQEEAYECEERLSGQNETPSETKSVNCPPV